MSLGTRYKDPQEQRLFTFDWSQHLEGEQVIAASTITVPDGLVNEGDAILDGGVQTSILVSGGAPGQNYVVTNTVMIAATDETLERSGVIAVRQL